MIELVIGILIVVVFLIGFGVGFSCGVKGLAWYIGTGKMDKELGL